jgi:hypothetical protein
MDKNFKTLLIVYLIENVSIIVLCGFLCWYFKSIWGLLPLLFMNTRLTKQSQKDVTQ